MQEKVSIIVPIYNAEKHLKKCIDSIIRQDYNKIEIILVNDGSTDSSEKICKQYINDKRIIYISKTNEGVSKTRNFGIEKATGKYIAFIDADDYVEKDFISSLVTKIQQGNYDMSICNYFENNDIDINEVVDLKSSFVSILNKNLYKGYIWNKLYKLEIIKNNNISFDSKVSVCEDMLFNYHYIDNCTNNLIFVNKKLYHYIQHDASVMHKKLTEKYLTIVDAYKEIKKVFVKNNIDYTEFLISYLKVLSDLIYRNSLLKTKLDMKKVNSEKKKCYASIKKLKISYKRKLEVYLYYKHPIIIGKLRTLKNRGDIH